ncbi:DNA polymerase III subunit gamma/tau [Robbsia sp. KACC 23696]|uniref:DNA polymerase III subunit gamma/tau n=1 Tax=Robbsia sp. KACC 23696 TaxID=3149231 RepID=UPI00325A8C09
MTYQVLARKWRPRDFPSLVGQDHVVRALTHALDQQRLHHAYLFTGTRGVGKTTLSRILAKALNCETGITSQPCGVCRACTEIDAGRFVDYVEMDAASNRGVDEMAALLERAIYAPVDARFKVYMIDEVHMLTNHAFNAMLKTLEEPPAHVKFILATTDPQKIPVTVLSRCLQFNLKQMPAHDIVDHLGRVLGEEQIAFEPQALRLLARAADGSMRDALSLTDQAIAYAAGMVSDEAVRGMLGALDQHYLVRLLDGLIANDGAAVLAVADDMATRSLSFSTALQDLAQWLNRIGWAQSAPGSVLAEWPEADDIRRFAQSLGAEQIQLYYQIATIGRSEMGLAPDEYAGFTMTLLRMLAFRPVSGTPFGGGGGISPSSAGVGSSGGGAVRGVSAAASVPAASARADAPAVATPAPVAPRASLDDEDDAAATMRAFGEPAGAAKASPATVQTAALIDVPSAVETSTPAVIAEPTGDAMRQPSAIASAVQATPAPTSETATEQADTALPDVVPSVPPTDAPAQRAADVEGDTVTPPSPSASTPVAPTPQTRAPLADDESASPASGARAALAALGVLRRSPSTAAPTGRRPPAAGATKAPPSSPSSLSSPTPSAPSARDAARPAPERGAADGARPGRTSGMPAPWEDQQDPDSAAADAFLASMGSGPSLLVTDEAPRPVTGAAHGGESRGARERGQGDGAGSAQALNTAEIPPPPPGIPMTAVGVASDWPAFAMTLDVKGLAQQLAHQSELIAVDQDRLQLRVPVTTLASGAHVEKVRAAILDRLGREVQLQVEVGAAHCTAAAVYAAERAALQRRAEASIRDDAFVRSLIDDFGASILPGATRPLSAR